MLLGKQKHAVTLYIEEVQEGSWLNMSGSQTNVLTLSKS